MRLKSRHYQTTHLGPLGSILNLYTNFQFSSPMGREGGYARNKLKKSGKPTTNIFKDTEGG